MGNLFEKWKPKKEIEAPKNDFVGRENIKPPFTDLPYGLISPSGWLAGAKIEEDKTRPRGKMKPQGVVNHFSCSYDAVGTLEWLKDNDGYSCHFLVDKAGQIFQMQPTIENAYHAGKSKWGPYTGLNDSFIGIEFVNLGPLIVKDDGFVDCYGKPFKGPYNRFSFDGYEYWEAFTPAQMKTMLWLNKTLMKFYGIPVGNIIAHHECSPDRKNDVGGSIGMSMAEFRNKLRSV